MAVLRWWWWWCACYYFLGGGHPRRYDETRALNVLFSQATQHKGSEATEQVRQVMLDLVRSETEAIFLSV